MKTITINETGKLTTRSLDNKDGCERVSDAETLKMRLLTGMRLSDDQFSKTVLEILNDKRASFSNKIFAVQNLARGKSAEAEDTLIRIASEKDTGLSYAALKTLALSGTEKAYGALSKIERAPFKSLEKQKDFALLMIGYRHQLAGTDEILKRLLSDAHTAKRREEFPIGFRLMEPVDIAAVLKQSAKADYGITLSRKTAFEVKVATQTFYFCFSNKFEDPAAWQEALQTKQFVGQLLKKEQHTTYISNQYIALVTPAKDHAQISIFRKNGELFMLANVVYNREKNSFTVTNTAGEQTRNTEQKDFSIEQKAFVTMSLSYIRRNKKRHAEIII